MDGRMVGCFSLQVTVSKVRVLCATGHVPLEMSLPAGLTSLGAELETEEDP